VAHETVFYVDLGWSHGMRAGWTHAKQQMCQCEFREIGGMWKLAGAELRVKYPPGFAL
jgi:hypothetical protein